jgi:hypothetical protein
MKSSLIGNHIRFMAEGNNYKSWVIEIILKKLKMITAQALSNNSKFWTTKTILFHEEKKSDERM